MRRVLMILFVSSVTASPQGYNYGQPMSQFPPPAATQTFGFDQKSSFRQQNSLPPPVFSKENYGSSTPGPAYLPSQPVNNYMPATNQQYLPPTPAATQTFGFDQKSSFGQQNSLPPPVFSKENYGSSTPGPAYLPPQPVNNYMPATNQQYLPPTPAATQTFGFDQKSSFGQQNSLSPPVFSKENYGSSTPGPTYLPPQPVNNYMPATNQQYLAPPVTYSSSQSEQTYYPSQLPQQTYLASFNSYSPASVTQPGYTSSATQHPVQPVPQPERNYLPATNQQTYSPPSNTFEHARITQQEPKKEYVPPQRETIIMKNFYVHTAPEDPEDDYQQQPIGSLNKHYRVVFIKAPVQKNAAEALKLAKPQDEEKTVIYVLSKKTDVSEVKAHIQSEPKPVSKPEVFFIRYKTKEEAEHAQHQIQAQYDALGGTSEISNEGVAPVHSVVGSLDSTEHHEPDTSESPSRQYLPPSK